MRRLLAWLTVNEVTTGSSGDYPGVWPLDLALSPCRTYDLALAAARGIHGWRIVTETPQEGWFEAEATTSVLRFVDDVHVWVEARDGGGSLLHVRSRSRIGRGDFGANARRIRKFLRLVGERAATRPLPG